MSSDQRVFAHWKSLKYAGPTPGSDTRLHRGEGCMLGGCSECCPSPTTPNWVWLRLARVHKMRVRDLKDLITSMRAEGRRK